MDLTVANKALEAANQALADLGCRYWVDCGTLLGLVREGKLLKHDADVDLSTWDWKRHAEIEAAMVKAGFRLHRTHGTPEHGYEQVFKMDSFKVDVFYFYREGETCWQGSWLDKHLIVSRFPTGLIGRTKKHGEFRVPSDPEGLLEARYGDWRTPELEWDWSRDPKCITPDTHPDMRDTTFLIKTFLRPHLVRACVQSIRDTYGDVRIVVVDDGNEDLDLDAQIIKLPYDTGLSAGRNVGVRAIDTKYVVLLDDDMTVGPDVPRLISLLSKGDIACGTVQQRGKQVRWEGFYVHENGGLILTQTEDRYENHKGTRWVAVDFGLNVFAAKTETLLANPWDERLKIHEHTDYFLRFPGQVVFTPDVSFEHTPERTGNYLKMRNRKEFRLRFFEKHRFAFHIGLNGHKDVWTHGDERALQRLLKQEAQMAAKKKATARKTTAKKTTTKKTTAPKVEESTSEESTYTNTHELVEPGGISSKLVQRREETREFERSLNQNLRGR